jgi:hypothetical protein
MIRNEAAAKKALRESTVDGLARFDR